MVKISGHLNSLFNIKRNLLLILFLACSISVVSQKTFTLIDSIIKYKGINPQKALDLSFFALTQFNLEEPTNDLVDINYLIGEIYYLKKNYDKSLKYLSQSLTIYETLPNDLKIHKNIEKQPWVLTILGNVYYENDNYEKAILFYNEAIKNFNLYEEKFNVDRAIGLNTIEFNFAQIAKNKSNFYQAMDYYSRILERINNELKVNNNIASLYTYLQIMDLYFLSGEDDLANKYFDLSTELYEKENTNNQIRSSYSKVISRYADNLKRKNQFREAIKFYEKAIRLISDSSYEISDINILISECYYAIKQYDKAEDKYLLNLKIKSLSLNDSIKNFNGLAQVYYDQKRNNDLNEVYRSIIKLYSNKNKNINFNDLENQMIIAEKQRDIINNNLRTYKNKIITILIASLSTIIIILLVFNYNFQKVKNSKLESEKKKIIIELDAKKRELVSKANFILQRNEYLKNIKIKLEKSKNTDNFFNQITREILELINSDKYYREFDKTFTKVYPEFYKKLNSIFKLSQTYLRLAAYIKMKQSNNEIAKITGISLRTVETQRYRLSKKLNLNKDQDLDTFIENL